MNILEFSVVNDLSIVLGDCNHYLLGVCVIYQRY